MSDNGPGWELYRSFLTVARERSLSGAARALGLSQPTLGRHIDALEQALGAPLFTRSRAGLLPTETARALLPSAEAMASAASAMVRIASGEAGEERGAVRVTASEMVGTHVLPAMFSSFRRACPAIDVELVVSNRTQDISRREADIAVRTVKPTQSSLLAKKVGVIPLGLHAHPSYLAAYGTPRGPEELAAHSLIGFDSAASLPRLPKVDFPLSREAFAFRCDSDLGQYAAICAGFGIGACQIPLARRDLLVPVLPSALRIELSVWVVMHKDLRASRRMKLMFDHLAVHLKAYCGSS